MDQAEASGRICSDEDIHKLLTHFVKTNHRVKNADVKGETIMELCTLLFAKDYKFTIIPNFNGELCSHYPMKLMITEFERSGPVTDDEHVESRHNQHQIHQMMKIARCARCRSRFVVPVIFFQGKHICRSGTLSGAAEMFGRSTSDYFMSNQNSSSMQGHSQSDVGKPDMFDRFRGYDIQLLKYFDVHYICDLMVEKKKMKFGLPFTSSEKVDKENRYSDFSILGMPYPGCEFFKIWKDNFYSGDTTVYDWGLALNDSSLDLPSCPFINDLGIDWTKYKDWSIVELTQNYLRLLLKYLKEASSGLLVHCISGWDRTPLFISLLRLSLWADGLVHPLLDATEMLYLTLGYDWYLFGHDLPDRLSNDEEVLFFCFKVLKDIASDKFSLNPRRPSIARSGSPLLRDLSPPQQFQPQQPSPPLQPQQQQQQPQRIRVDSDGNLGMPGILLADDLMTFPNKGSTGSLTSLASSDGPTEPIHFSIGDIKEEEEDGGGGARGGGEGSRNASIPQRRSMSPSVAHASPNSLRHSSPVNTIANRRRRRSSDSQRVDGQPLSIQSNYFMGSPVQRSSSPMFVPVPKPSEDGSSNPPVVASTHSVGSWQIIPSADNLRSMDSSNSNGSTDRSIPFNQICEEAGASNTNTLRWQRLDTVSRLFESAYIRAVPSSHHRSSSVGAGISSFLDKFAEQVGFRGGGSNQGRNGNTRRGV